jgi:hypothetical protein
MAATIIIGSAFALNGVVLIFMFISDAWRGRL